MEFLHLARVLRYLFMFSKYFSRRGQLHDQIRDWFATSRFLAAMGKVPDAIE